ncbi:hypothetical protein EMIHUDRAFT_255651 [Emiliania huxleyi CCMP1516]|uniref:Uncharacterized protein n=2 Tax=Emiliania huxleyi TaxID=2903 RepID=A0A0D3J792_EMIH1|nr:hypothetical protein EMIHUDRAFT_255651 [Emiliania huxleyi CCMP1516]EOD19377.1 hypothetical protein EMIHUDRAFT_255651 [Emiliania huxleyi CCMP1516]|eukprot:XP_005771806.1 hypothetical protein EMIHUDRAFT_255651 [Emiliania huxleyi CCMP1516]
MPIPIFCLCLQALLDKSSRHCSSSVLPPMPMPRGSAEKRSTPSGAHVTLPRGKGSMSKAAVRGGAAAWQFLRCACQASADLASTVLLERDKYSALGGGLLGGATMWTGAMATLPKG